MIDKSSAPIKTREEQKSVVVHETVSDENLNQKEPFPFLYCLFWYALQYGIAYIIYSWRGNKKTL